MTKTNLRECRSCHQKYNLSQMGSYYTEGSSRRRWRCKLGFGCLSSDTVIEDCLIIEPDDIESDQEVDEFMDALGESNETSEDDDLFLDLGTLEDPDLDSTHGVIGKVYVITSAVSNCPINKPFFDALLNYCNHNNAELLIKPISYKFPHESLGWDEQIRPYILKDDFNLNDRITVFAKFDISPTAANPLSGMQGHGKARSGIFPHPKLQMKPVATPGHSLPKIQTTTGCVTINRYIPKKTGAKAEHHHNYSAVVVEIIDDKLFFYRHISFKDNGFYDLNKFYDSDGSVTQGGLEALHLGDTHVDMICPTVFDITFARQDSIVSIMKPKTIIHNDTFDCSRVNHHNLDSPFFKIANHKASTVDVMGELESAIEYIETCHAFSNAKQVIINSNHDDALSRWIQDRDWKDCPVNAEVYLETALAMVRSTQKQYGGFSFKSAFGYWVDKLIGKDVDYQMIGNGESYKVLDIECGMHGHKGANGARGSLNTFSKAGVKMITGHAHWAGVEGSAWQSGTMSVLNPGYATGGLSNWTNTHTGIYPNGKRVHLHIINGRYSNMI